MKILKFWLTFHIRIPNSKYNPNHNHNPNPNSNPNPNPKPNPHSNPNPKIWNSLPSHITDSFSL